MFPIFVARWFKSVMIAAIISIVTVPAPEASREQRADCAQQQRIFYNRPFVWIEFHGIKLRQPVASRYGVLNPGQISSTEQERSATR